MEARKEWTAAVCSTFLSSWRLLAPVTLSQTNGVPGNRGAALHRFFATATDVRSLRARRARARSVRAMGPLPAMGRVTRRNPSRGVTSWEALGTETANIPARSVRVIQGQSEMRSRARFSAGLRVAGSR